MDKKVGTLIVLLVIGVVIVWGLSALQKKSADNTNPKVTTFPTNTPVVVPPAPSVDVVKLLAENPGSGATKEQLTTFSAKVSGYSKDATSIDVSGCVPNPTVSRIKLNTPIIFKNTDAASHKLVNGNLTINVPANSSTAIIPEFASLGIYGYSCDTKITGIFLVVP